MRLPFEWDGELHKRLDASGQERGPHVPARKSVPHHGFASLRRMNR
ncbi:MAG TPA: hypothetical protein VF518_12550 [Polyangia bacterium]